MPKLVDCATCARVERGVCYNCKGATYTEGLLGRNTCAICRSNPGKCPTCKGTGKVAVR